MPTILQAPGTTGVFITYANKGKLTHVIELANGSIMLVATNDKKYDSKATANAAKTAVYTEVDEVQMIIPIGGAIITFPIKIIFQ